VLTCIGNDYSFDDVFARQIEAIGQPGDLLVVFTTSGQSPNVVRGLKSG
jgi:D-sedoheptulose 7-phosphate isomerase